MSEKEKSFVVDIKTDENGEHFIELSEELLELVGWKIGDDLIWVKNEDGSIALEKQEEEDDTSNSGN